ncbi:hypothetical protein MKEN_01335500 [Mycena kentingensis (nom. inval.)]|nr:hypothetical protein MKEN_01335500 [Mycena kentingensis (nom. inval.)]
MHPSLRLAPEKFPATLRAHVTAAYQGSFLSLDQLYERSKGLSDRLKRLLLPVWYAALEPLDLEDAQHHELDAASVKDRMYSASMGLLALLDLLAHKHIERPAVIELWPRIYAWLLVFDVLRDQITILAPMPCTTILTMLGRYDTAERVLDAMRASPRMPYLLARMWPALVVDGALGTLEDFANTFVMIVQTETGGISDEAFAQVMEALDGEYLNLAETLVGQLRRACQIEIRPQHDRAIIAKCTFNTFKALMTTDEELRNALLKRGFVPTLTGLIRALSSSPSDRDIQLRKLIEDACAVLMGCFADPIAEEGRGRTHKYLVQALDSGFLQLLELFSQSEYRYLLITHLQPHIDFILSRHVVYASVAGKLKDSIVLLFDLARGADEFGLKSCVKRTKQIVRHLDDFQSEKRVRERACSYPNCHVISAKRELKRCSGCLMHLYCSDACQRRDWRGGHDKFCAKIRAGGVLGSRNLSFFRFLQNIDLRANSEEIAQWTMQACFMAFQLQYHLRPDKLNVPCVFFNYSTGTCEVLVAPSASLSWLEVPRAQLDWIHDSGGRVQLHVFRQCIAPMEYREDYGHGPRETKTPPGTMDTLRQHVFPFYVSAECARMFAQLQDIVGRIPPAELRMAAALALMKMQPILMVAAIWDGFEKEMLKGSY